MAATAEAPGSRPSPSAHGLFVILGATAIALLATPLVSPAMPEIARVFADQAESEPFARAILGAISIVPGEPSVAFLVKFILLSIPALFIILGAPFVGWLSSLATRQKVTDSQPQGALGEERGRHEGGHRLRRVRPVHHR